MDIQTLAKTLRSGGTAYGTLVISTSPRWVTSIANTGVDLAFIDTEHVPIDREFLSAMCYMYAGKNIAPLVRVPEPSAYEACKVLDGGAQAVLFPYVENINEVKRLVGAVRWRPLKGETLENVLNGGEPPKRLKEYLENRNRYFLSLINVESVHAVEHLDELLRIDGLDGIVIGPHDLSCNMGIPEDYESPEYDEMIKKIIKKTRQAGKIAGMHIFRTHRKKQKWIGYGINLVIYSADMDTYVDFLSAELDALRAGCDIPSPKALIDTV